MQNKISHIRSLAAGENNFVMPLATFSILLLAFSFFTLRSGNLLVLLGIALPIMTVLIIKAPYIFPLGIYLFFLPFDSVLVASGGPGGHAETFTRYIGIVTIAVLFLKGAADRRLRKPPVAVLWWVLFIAVALFSAVWAMNLNTEAYTTRAVTALGLLLLYIAISVYPFREKEYETLKKFVMFGGLAAAVLVALNYGDSQMYMGSQRATLTNDEMATDPNQFAFSLLIPSAIALQQMLNSKKIMTAIFYSGVFAAIAYVILVSGSRGGALGAVIIAAYLLFHSERKSRIIIILAMLAAIVIFFSPEDYYQRITTDAYERGGAGRLDIWKVGLEAFSHNWLYGVGLDNFPYAYDFYSYAAPQAKFEGYTRAAHNIYLAITVELGIVGLLIFAAGIISHFRIIKRSADSQDKFLLKACLIGCVAQAFTLDVIWRKSFWLLWMLIVMYNLAKPRMTNEPDSTVAHVPSRRNAL